MIKGKQDAPLHNRQSKDNEINAKTLINHINELIEPHAPKEASIQDTINDFFDTSVFQNLPPILSDCTRVFSDEIEINLVFIGAITVLSGCMPNVYGTYDKDKIGANFYAFIVAPASSGKGCLKWSKSIAQSIHKDKRVRYDELKKEYEQADDKDSIIHPKQLMHFIPANSSTSAMIEVLQNNDGRGTLFCSEADTLSGALKQDWGNFSDILRSAFHHEPINFLRRKNDEYKEVENPYLSILISGTPRQVHGLIPEVENGLLSRFAFFTFRSRPMMKNVFENSNIDFDVHFKHIQQQVKKLYDYLNDSPHPIQFILKCEHQNDFLKMFSESHTEFHLNLGDESLASVRRLGVVMFRICMILTVARLNTNESHPTQMQCSDSDYNTAKSICETLKKHTAKIFTKMQDEKCSNSNLSDNRFKLYNALPQTEFKRKEANGICKKMNIGSATLDRLLNDSDYFEKVGYGTYRKVHN